ncbi:hypothetical protein ACFOYY_40300 [Streptosporangium jomthongense]|uniref:Uncharacterized protein n=2 Tax=Streptosporangium jomthongense TaxID=1193683 RepID=A0ABV8FCJ6_9ACTN
MASGVYLPTMEDILDTTQLALNWDAETHKWALYTSSRAPDYNANTAYSSTNEISGTGYTAGGQVVTGTAFSRPGAGVSKYSTDAVQWASSTLSGVRYVDMYADALAGDNLMIGIDLGTGYNTNDGTLLITPHSNGLMTIDWTP